MKRLAIFCDGTWNKLASPTPTNVVLGTKGVLLNAPDGTTQLTYYGEGVGTSYLISKRLAAMAAGAFGLGLFEKVADAYRFLVLNYEQGDEVYIFGFSRGAFTARALAGLIANCGILSRAHIDRAPKAFHFYETRTKEMLADSVPARKFRAAHSYRTLMTEEEREWRKENAPRPELVTMPLFEIAYLGVWDTVGALGIPEHLFLHRVFRSGRKYQFFDTDLSRRVASARHAVAIDETRKSFKPTLWTNLAKLRSEKDDAERYQQLWFPGDHGSVGGGGDIVGLSRAAMIWILEGAERQGLALDHAQIDEWEKDTDFMAPLRNRSKPTGGFDRIYRRAPRDGPKNWDDLSQSAQKRLLSKVDPQGAGRYVPKSLEGLFDEVERRRALE